MAIQNIHKQAILKLVNSFTTFQTRVPDCSESSSSSSVSTPGTSINQVLFKEAQTTIDLSCLPRLAYIISKFEQYFRPNSLIINGNVSKMNNQNFIYLQQITSLIEYIENNSLLKIKFENNLETTLQRQSSQHVQMLILLIRDWMLQFYLDKNFIYELFPSTTSNEGTTFSLVNIKENNVFLISLLIFNIFYKVRCSFSEYSLLLEFSWICFTDLEPYISMANLDSEYIYSMLQSSLLSARIEEEQEAQINFNLHRQIDMLNNKIIDSKKRMLGFDVCNSVSSNKNPMKSHGESSKAAKSAQSDSKYGSNRQMANSFQSKVFPSSSNEIKRVERPYKCEICLKSFPTSYKLNRHSYSHSGERPYLCSWPNCDKRFNDNYHLRRHMNTHTGEKPYPCKYPGCPKRYSRSEDLRNHQKTHFNNGLGTNAISSIISNQQQTMGVNLSQTQQNHHQSTSLHPHHSQQSSNPLLVPQSIMPSTQTSQQTAAVKSSNSSNHHTSHHHQHRSSGQQAPDTRLIQDQLNQLQQMQQQNYSSSANLHHHHSTNEESSSLQPSINIMQETISSPPNSNHNQATSNQQQQNNTAANLQHITENYF